MLGMGDIAQWTTRALSLVFSFHALLSGILEQIGQLSEAIAQLYFSHAIVSQEISGIREERET